MKITKIEEIDANIYQLKIKYNIFEKIFGFKDGYYLFKRNPYETFWLSGKNVYYNEDGSQLPPNSKISDKIECWKNRIERK